MEGLNRQIICMYIDDKNKIKYTNYNRNIVLMSVMRAKK